MADCPYYHIEVKRVEGRGMLRSDRQRVPPMNIEMPWCAHPKHSPVDHLTATGTLGGGRLLKCGGDRKQCPLTQKEFDDA